MKAGVKQCMQAYSTDRLNTATLSEFQPFSSSTQMHHVKDYIALELLEKIYL